MYARCTRYDREVQMPYPFIYSLSKDGKPFVEESKFLILGQRARGVSTGHWIVRVHG